MGYEILYCARCGSRISGADFERGVAFRVSGRSVCSGCIRKELSATSSAAPVVLQGCRDGLARTWRKK